MCSRDSLTDLSIMKNFETVFLHTCVRNWLKQDVNGGAQPMDIGQIDKSEGEDEDVSAVQQRHLHDRSNQRHRQESDVVARAILPDSAHQRKIPRTWMKSEQSRPVMPTATCLVWVGATTPSRPSIQ